MELAKKCTGKGQKCCSVSDNEDMSKKIFENKNVKHSHKVTQNYIEQTKQEVTNISFALTCTGLEKVLVQKCYTQEKMVLQASYQSLMVAKKKKLQFMGLRYYFLIEVEP